jgi:hypothetical protein
MSFLKCFRILCRLVCPLNVQKGTVFLQSQVILHLFDVDVPFISVRIPRVGEAGHKVFEGWNT